MKQTWQKKAILDTVQNMKNHPTADEVHNELCKQYSGVGIATVYRNLNGFAQKGLINKVTLPNAADRFDYRLDSHEHFLCEKCGKVHDANVTVNITSKSENIKYTGYSLTLLGVCADCNSTKQ